MDITDTYKQMNTLMDITDTYKQMNTLMDITDAYETNEHLDGHYRYI